MKLPHETPNSQTVAGIYHVGFAVLYAVAIWHLRGAFEHFKSSNDGTRSGVRKT